MHLPIMKPRRRLNLPSLNEQAAIARQLGIADNQAGLATLGTNGIGINVNTDLPAYLRGFKALEKEIALINSRGTGDAVLQYITELPRTGGKASCTETDKRLERIEKGVNLTPLKCRKFCCFNYDLDAMSLQIQHQQTTVNRNSCDLDGRHDCSDIRAHTSHYGTAKPECLERLSCADAHIYICCIYPAGNGVGRRLETAGHSITIS